MVPTSDKSTNAILGGAAFHTSERKRNTHAAMSEMGSRRFCDVRDMSGQGLISEILLSCFAIEDIDLARVCRRLPDGQITCRVLRSASQSPL
jgi:hypothetical protein